MKCKSCSEDIPQKFGHAIATNICPYCGDEIMELELQSALVDLREIMKIAEKYQVEVFDWLHSNYDLISKDSDEYKALKERAEIIPVRQPAKEAIKSMDPNTVELDRNGNQISGAPIQDQATTSVFMKRAQVKPEQKNLRDIVSQIKKSGGVTTSITAEADPEDVAAMEAELGGDEGVGSLNGGSSMEFDEMGSDEALPAVVEAMAIQAAGGPKGSDYNARDVAKLQQIHGKRSRASNELVRGGGVGLIRRG